MTTILPTFLIGAIKATGYIHSARYGAVFSRRAKSEDKQYHIPDENTHREAPNSSQNTYRINYK